MGLECSGFSQIFSERTHTCPRVIKGRLDSQSWAFKRNFFAFLRGVVGKSRQTPRVRDGPAWHACECTEGLLLHKSPGGKLVALAALRCWWCQAGLPVRQGGSGMALPVSTASAVPFSWSQVCVLTPHPSLLSPGEGPTRLGGSYCFWRLVPLLSPPVTCHIDSFEPVFQPPVQLSKIHFGDMWIFLF